MKQKRDFVKSVKRAYRPTIGILRIRRELLEGIRDQKSRDYVEEYFNQLRRDLK
jgi:hypothetical protein